jgi:hypothetical protein
MRPRKFITLLGGAVACVTAHSEQATGGKADYWIPQFRIANGLCVAGARVPPRTGGNRVCGRPECYD